MTMRTAGRIARFRRRIVGAVGAVALTAAAMTAMPTASAGASGVAITGVAIDKIAYTDISLREILNCNVKVSFTDATPLGYDVDGFYRLMVGTKQVGRGNASGDADGIAWAPCGGAFEDGVAASLMLQEVVRSEATDDYVVVEQSEPLEWTYRELGHPNDGHISGIRTVTKEKVPVLTTGEKQTVSLDGEWADEAKVTIRVMAGKGWLPFGQQDAGAKRVRATFNKAAGTWSFRVPHKFAGRSIYVSIKGTDGRKVSQVTDYGFTWQPMLAVAPKAKATKSSWIKSMGKKKVIKSKWLSAGKPELTKAGEKVGVKFVYEAWSGRKRDAGAAWHTSRPSEAFRCPTTAQHLRVLAYVPGRIPVVAYFRKGAVCGKRIARGQASDPVGPAAGGTTIGPAIGSVGPARNSR